MVLIAGLSALGAFVSTSGTCVAPLRTRESLKMASVAEDAEAWLTFNLGNIASKRSMASGSGGASLMRYTLEGSRCDVVVKTSRSKNLEQMFLGEALGLRALRASGSMVVPEVFHFDDCIGGSYLIMEFMEFSGRADPSEFGRCMAQMHAAEPLDHEARAGKFGFKVDNTIGATPQPNSWTAGTGTAAWVEFFRDRRIGHQLRLARDERMKKEWERVLEATDGLATLFRSSRPCCMAIYGAATSPLLRASRRFSIPPPTMATTRPSGVWLGARA